VKVVTLNYTGAAQQTFAPEEDCVLWYVSVQTSTASTGYIVAFDKSSLLLVPSVAGISHALIVGGNTESSANRMMFTPALNVPILRNQTVYCLLNSAGTISLFIDEPSTII
jgi:hypothetical protein